MDGWMERCGMGYIYKLFYGVMNKRGLFGNDKLASRYSTEPRIRWPLPKPTPIPCSVKHLPDDVKKQQLNSLPLLSPRASNLPQPIDPPRRKKRFMEGSMPCETLYMEVVPLLPFWCLNSRVVYISEIRIYEPESGIRNARYKFYGCR